MLSLLSSKWIDFDVQAALRSRLQSGDNGHPGRAQGREDSAEQTYRKRHAEALSHQHGRQFEIENDLREIAAQG
jgi:hypothetical protein